MFSINVNWSNSEWIISVADLLLIIIEIVKIMLNLVNRTVNIGGMTGKKRVGVASVCDELEVEFGLGEFFVEKVVVKIK